VHKLQQTIMKSSVYDDKNISLCDDFSMSFPEFTRRNLIRFLRHEKRLGQNQLGVHHTTISRLERGDSEDLDQRTREAIKKHLGMSLDEIDEMVEILNGRIMPAGAGSSFSCEKHKKLHEYFEYVLEEGNYRADWIAGSVVTFYSQWTMA